MASAEVGYAVLTGMVVTQDGWPVPHAVVTIIDGKGLQSGRSTVSQDGHFAVTGLAPGTYTVITAAAGHAPYARTRQVNAAGQVDLGRLVLGQAGGIVAPTPGIWNIDPTHSTVSATAVHLGFAKIHGRFQDFSGTLTVADPLEDSSVEVIIDAASIDTDNLDRDTHLCSPDFLDVATFPQIRYAGSGVTVLNPQTWVLDGELTMKSVTRPVPLHVNYLGTGDGPMGDVRTGFHVTAQLDRDQFGMIWNLSLLAGVFAVGRTLRITIDLEAVYQQS
ncbi:MAG: YceI family protein [Pseudonocardiaceae bacterium]